MDQKEVGHGQPRKFTCFGPFMKAIMLLHQSIEVQSMISVAVKSKSTNIPIVCDVSSLMFSPHFHRDAWRYQGVFSKSQRFKGLFPGFYLGLGAFVAYSLYEDYLAPKSHH